MKIFCIASIFASFIFLMFSLIFIHINGVENRFSPQCKDMCNMYGYKDFKVFQKFENIKCLCGNAREISLFEVNNGF